MNSDPARWAEIREVFEAASDRTGADRLRFIAHACRGDPHLEEEVRALLDASSDQDFLREPRLEEAARLLEDVAAADHVGAQVGHFRLTRLLGRGGMGDVYEAERDDGAFEQRVAVKLIRSAFSTDDLVRRFEREREILASLGHPSIAHLIDGGVSTLGPYLAMEYVDGEQILEYSAKNRLGLRERLGLFASVADAVHFAHQKLVVHRDLKPSNVLVTQDGRVKLLDFGIAGLLGDRVLAAEALTRTGFHLMTPEYASPEQVRGETLSTSSDVYALGVLLYELLTGRRPHDLRGLSPAAIERKISEEPVVRPSDAMRGPGGAREAGASTDPPQTSHGPFTRSDRLRRRLRGDLDTIVLRAMHRDPLRRYESAAALAADLRRHLTNRPVVARPDTLGYRLSTFVRRNRTTVVAAVVVGSAIAVGTTAASYQARRAETRFEDTRRLANALLDELDGALEDLPGATPVRAMLVSQGLNYLNALAQDPGADNELKLEVADAYEKIGAIQGNPYYTNLGDLAASRSSYEQSLAIREAVFATDPSRVLARVGLANAYGHLARVESAEGDIDLSMRLARFGLDLLAPVGISVQPDQKAARVEGRLRTVIGGGLVFEGQFEQGLAELGTAVETLESIAVETPDDLELTLDLWESYAGQMDGWRFSSHFDQGLSVLTEKACPMLERLADAFPTRPAAIFGLYECYDYRGTMEEHLELARAEASYDLALKTAEKLRDLDPANERANEAVSVALLSIGRLLFRIRGSEEGRPHLEDALRIRLDMEERNPSNDRWTRLVSSVQRELCRGLLYGGDPEGALPYCEESVRTQEASLANVENSAVAEAILAYAFAHTARAYRTLAEQAEGIAERRRLRELALVSYRNSVAAYQRAGDFPEDTAWEVHPSDVSAELEALGARGGPIAD